MRSFAPDAIRNVALVGHGGDGQDDAGRGPARRGRGHRPARAGRGRHDRLRLRARGARARGISLGLGAGPRSSGRATRSTSLDTPGFARLPRRGAWPRCAVADLAVFVVSAVDGVAARHPAAVAGGGRPGPPPHGLREQARPRPVVVRRHRSPSCARPSAPGVAPLELPIGSRGRLPRGRRPPDRHRPPLRRRPAHAAGPSPRTWSTQSTRSTTTSSRASSWATTTSSSATSPATCPLGRGAGAHPCPGRRRRRPSSPWCAARPLARIGIDRLADFLCEIGPSPARPPGASTVEAGDDDRRRWRPTPPARPLVQVFRTSADPFVGQVSLFRVLSGTVRPDDHLVNPRTGTDERLHALFTLRGREHVEVTDGARRRHRRGRQAERHLDRRHARPQGDPGRRRRRGPCPSRSTGWRWLRPTPPTRTSWPPPCTAWSTTTPPCVSAGTTRSTRPSSAARATCTWRGPRAAHPEVRRGGRHRGGAHPLPGDHRRPGSAEGRLKKQSGGHGQFAVVSPRGRAPRARRRVSSSSTRSSAAPSPASTSRRWRRAWWRRWPRVGPSASRWSTSGCAAPTASTTPSTPRRWRSRRRRAWPCATPWPLRGPVALEPISRRRGHRAERASRARSSATSPPAGVGCRAPCSAHDGETVDRGRWCPRPS